MQLELINISLKTILLDCISYYPKRGQQKECFGLIFGEQNAKSIGEYMFPIGNVIEKTADSVMPDEYVNSILRESKKLQSVRKNHIQNIFAIVKNEAEESNANLQFDYATDTQYLFLIKKDSGLMFFLSLS